MDDDEITLRAGAAHRAANEWGLVLAAAAIPYRLVREGDDWCVVVGVRDVARAAEALDAFEHEERPLPPPAAPALPEWGPTPAGVVMGAALVVAYRLAGPRATYGPGFAAGSADAARILDGQWWRTVTALTLHADPSHLIGNLGAGVVLATGVCRIVGPGVGTWLVVLSGVLGNAITALLTGDGHDAVGASTAVLGAVGVLSGLAIVRTRRAAGIRGRAWLPLGAGLALLAMLGSGKGTDLTSHLFGFVAGIALGATAAVLPLQPRWRQYVLATTAIATVAGSWLLALRG